MILSSRGDVVAVRLAGHKCVGVDNVPYHS
jgi:hypothetical protein